MSDTPRRVTRTQLSGVAGDPRMLRALEQMLEQVSVDVPQQITEIAVGLAEAVVAIAANSVRRVNPAPLIDVIPDKPQSRAEIQQILIRLEALETALRSSRAAEAALRREIEDLKQIAT